MISMKRRARRVLIILGTVVFVLYMAAVFAGLLVMIFNGGLNP